MFLNKSNNSKNLHSAFTVSSGKHVNERNNGGIHLLSRLRSHGFGLDVEMSLCG